MKPRILTTTLLFSIFFAAVSVFPDVRHEKINEENFITHVTNDAWQPAGFDQALIVRARFAAEPPVIDGSAEDTVWAQAESLKVPLSYGKVREATLKAVYTEKEIFLLVSWPDPTKDEQYRPWIWKRESGRYVEGPQVDDGLLISFEAGCEWTPSLLSGYVFDFDGWWWLAGRTNPIGQAVDTSGHVQKRWIPERGYTKYESRNKKPFWNLKFTDNRTEILTKPWQELNRAYLLQPVVREVYVSNLPDGRPPPAFTAELPAPAIETRTAFGPSSAQASGAPEPVALQYKPVKLTGDAGEVTAKGKWANGRWTVEFRRARVTPARTTTDSMFTRVTQFSIHVFDHTERVDEAAESGRLFLEFVPRESAKGK